MVVRVKLFARARDLAGVGELTVSLPEGATVADLRRALAVERPALAGLMTRSAIALDDDFASDDVVVRDGAEVALLPPVSGG
jgi:molybdopterin converting factor subunit 1